MGQYSGKDKANKNILKDFLRSEEIRGRTEQTLKGLKRRVPHFFQYAEENCLNSLHIGLEEALNYQKWLLETRKQNGEKRSPRTVLSYMGAVTSFYEYLKRMDLVLNNPFKSVPKVRAEKKLPRNLLKEKETDFLLDEMSHFNRNENLKDKLRKYRVHVLLEVLYSTGLRISEAAALTLEDVNLEQGSVRVIEGKGGKDRVCFLNSYSEKILRIYLQEIRPLLLHGWHEDKDSVFLGHKDRLASWVRNEIGHYTKEHNLPSLSCHTFRHLMGYHLLRSGCGIRSIQALLGHSRLNNTEIYTRVDKDDLQAVLDQYHPRKWKERKES